MRRPWVNENPRGIVNTEGIMSIATEALAHQDTVSMAVPASIQVTSS